MNEPLHSSVPGGYSLVSSPSDRFQELYFLIIKHLFSNYLIVGHYAGYSSKAFLSSICCYGLSSYEQGLECLSRRISPFSQSMFTLNPKDYNGFEYRIKRLIDNFDDYLNQFSEERRIALMC